MKQKMCILADVRAVLIQDGTLEVYRIAGDGIEVGDPVHSERVTSSDDRLYRCNNCGATTPGHDSFTMKDHLGRFHELVDPFNWPEKETPG